MPNCLDCANCTWVHEYECYICNKKKRMPFVYSGGDPIECEEFTEYFEED